MSVVVQSNRQLLSKPSSCQSRYLAAIAYRWKLYSNLVDLDSKEDGYERYSLTWLAHTFKVLSRLITSLTFLVSLCDNRRTSPVPRSFHSEDSASNLKSFARLAERKMADCYWFRLRSCGLVCTHILKRTSSSSSCVFVSTYSVSLTTGSYWASGSSS